MSMRRGQRVRVVFPGPIARDELGELLEGPLARRGRVVWQVRILGDGGADVWVPETWIRPLLRSVDGQSL